MGSPSAIPSARALKGGHLGVVLNKGLLEAYRAWSIECDGDFLVHLGWVPHLVAVDPASVRRVLTDDSNFIRNIQPTRNLFDRGLLRLEGDAWLARRTLIADAFRRGAMNTAIPIVREETELLVEAWKRQRTGIRPARDLSTLMLRILGRFLFDFEFDRQQHGGPTLHRSLIALSTDSVLRHLLGPTAATLIGARDIRAARSYLDRLCEDILSCGGPSLFLNAIRQALNDGVLDHRCAIDEIRSMLIAGHETSATAAAWATAMLACHPELAGEVRAEGHLAGAATCMADVQGLTATSRWVKETMRLYPPVPISVCQAAQDTCLGETEIPRGTRVDLCSYVVHRDPRSWDSPDQFRPERFFESPELGTYLPFLMGQHTCLGIHLAMIELPLVTARLARAFEFTLPRGLPKVNLRLSLHPKDFWVNVEPRR